MFFVYWVITMYNYARYGGESCVYTPGTKETIIGVYGILAKIYDDKCQLKPEEDDKQG